MHAQFNFAFGSHLITQALEEEQEEEPEQESVEEPYVNMHENQHPVSVCNQNMKRCSELSSDLNLRSVTFTK